MPTRTPSTTPAMTLTDWGLLVALAAVWGGSYVFIKVAVEDIGPLSVVFMRTALAATILYGILRLRGLNMPRTAHAWKHYAVLGATNGAIPFSLIFWGETRIPSALAGILTAMVPIFTVLAAHVMTHDERLTPAKIAGIGLGMVGVIVILGEGLSTLNDGSLLGKLAVVVATILYGYSNVYARKVKGRPPLELACGQMTAAAIWTLPLMLLDRPWSTAHWHGDAIAALLALVLISTVLAYMLYFRLLATVGATNTSQIGFLIPVSAMLLGVFTLNEHIAPIQLAGLLLIVLGMTVLDGRLWRRDRKTGALATGGQENR